MSALIINIQVDDPKGVVNSQALGKFIAEMISREIGDDVRTNVTDSDAPMNTMQKQMVIDGAMRNPLMGMR